MLAIADHANNEGTAWPGVRVLSQKARIGVRQTKELIQRCIEAGELKEISRGGGCKRENYTRYGIILGDLGESAKGAETCTNSTLDNVQDSAENVQDSAEKVQDCAPHTPYTRVDPFLEPLHPCGGGAPEGEEINRVASLANLLRGEGVQADPEGLVMAVLRAEGPLGPPIIRRAVDRRRAGRLSPGWLVNTLKSKNGERDKLRDGVNKSTQARKAPVEPQAADRQRQKQEREAEARERQANIDALADAELSAWKTRAIATNPTFRRTWEGADARTHRPLQVAIITMMKAAGQLPPVAGTKATG